MSPFNLSVVFFFSAFMLVSVAYSATIPKAEQADGIKSSTAIPQTGQVDGIKSTTTTAKAEQADGIKSTTPIPPTGQADGIKPSTSIPQAEQADVVCSGIIFSTYKGCPTKDTKEMWTFNNKLKKCETVQVDTCNKHFGNIFEKENNCTARCVKQLN